ncbi:chemotaxis protein [Hahella sp. SMD15-11]|uniref:Chemotaxis protein n=1 Tax=Thermohahella caldifontis TaxID=3142973 RepID=A0AB39UY50_9GAMM
MVETSLKAKQSSSFNLVQQEILHTIDQAEASLDRFQENRESGEDLQNCVDDLNQLRGIFTLIELNGGTVLCQEAVALANEVPVGASEDKNPLLAALSEALFVLRRYTEYFEHRREDHPELLLPMINRLREARNARPLPESYFFEVEFHPNSPTPIPNLNLSQGQFTRRARQLRLMYQVGLLGLLRKREVENSYRLIERAAHGFCRLVSTESAIHTLWELVEKAAWCMREYDMLLSANRQRLFMKVETYARELARIGIVAAAKNVRETVARDLLYIIWLSGSTDESVVSLLSRFGIQPTTFNESKLSAHRSMLMGPGSDVLRSLGKALQEELDQVKDRLDILERGLEDDPDAMNQLASALGRLANTLLMLDLRQLSDLLVRQQHRLEGWSRQAIRPREEDLLEVADAILGVEQAILQLEDDGLTHETDKRATVQTTLETSPYLTEAQLVVYRESQAALALAKKAITAYIESGGDKLHLANVVPTLQGVEGALIMIEQKRAARDLGACAQCIQDKLVDAEKRPDSHFLETLADALTALEYYVDSLNRSEVGTVELLKLCDESLRQLGYAA